MSTKALVHLAGEHALELQLLDGNGVLLDIGHDRVEGVLVAFHFGEIEELAGVLQGLLKIADADHDLLQLGAFAAELLGVLRVVPDVRAFQLAGHFLKTFDLAVVVKETPEAGTAAARGRRSGCGRD